MVYCRVAEHQTLGDWSKTSADPSEPYETMPQPPSVWDAVLRRLEPDVPAFARKAWLESTRLELGSDGATLVCPSSFHRDRVRERYAKVLKSRLGEELGTEVSLNLVVGTVEDEAADPAQPEPTDSTTPRALPRPDRGERVPPAPRSEARRNGERPQPTHQMEIAYGFDSFVVGPCNALAREAALAVAQGRQPGANPLLLVSDEGLGKTHLARAIVSEARNRDHHHVVYASAETFTGEFTSAVRSRQMDRFKRRYRSSELLVVENVQFLQAKKGTQLELFHTLSHLLDAGSRVVLTSDHLPCDLEQMDSRLSSQMTSGLVAEMEPPDAEVRRRILRSKAAHGGIRLPPDCLDLLVHSLRGSVRDLTGVLVQLTATASLLKRPIDLELIENALRKVAPENRRAVRLQPVQVIDTVAAFFGSSPNTLASRSRTREVLHPRQIAMYLCRRYTDATLGEIAQRFRRSHPSVTNAVRAVERRMLERPKLRYQIEELCSRLDSLAP
ncbi:chromosomal replication initiator protein DnaA [Myxococcota bacterium]|nr:chromosomal replication initiator protein DnaA [Myxococcota bacterium]